jgi:hypothetical protein
MFNEALNAPIHQILEPIGDFQGRPPIPMQRIEFLGNLAAVAQW